MIYSQDLLDELANKRTSVAVSEDDSKWLVRMLPDDDVIKPELREEVTKINSALDDAEEKLRERKRKLQRVLVEEPDTKKAHDSFVDFLSTIEFRVNSEKVLATEWQKLSEQTQEQRVMFVSFILRF